jgi:NADPH:quinone reductase-like Zn-dependent oxidoreductase
VGLSALQIIDKLTTMKSGTKILINGATGGIGIFLTQLAKKRGAVITAVTGARGMMIAKKWGADEVIGYKTQPIFSANKKYDVVVDLSGKFSFKDAKSLMHHGTTFITTIPGLKTMTGSFLNNLCSATKCKVLILKPTNDSLKSLAHLIEEGLDIVVEKVYPMTDVRSAYDEVARGGILGKAVITV